MWFRSKNECGLVVTMYHSVQNLYGIISSKVNLSFNTKLLNNIMFLRLTLLEGAIILGVIFSDYRNLEVVQETLNEMVTAIINEFLQPDINGLQARNT